ncbi:hypothetical protein HYALB_00010780 [Hymenoscyphus albidus]|uniref:Uncharacterized protein n=1 Tax=Hymenoscyphus albidus TaxID=595503 RepID=A0A9N9LQR3_9HELO|nr:hypothetical protein HYALB_00010780 [Hymenoscyphus albidus]
MRFATAKLALISLVTLLSVAEVAAQGIHNCLVNADCGPCGGLKGGWVLYMLRLHVDEKVR